MLPASTKGGNMKKLVLTFSAVFALAACGGGGEDAPQAPAYFNGTYSGALIKTQDNCFIGGQYNGAVHVLRTEGSEVVVTINALVMRGVPNESGILEAVYESKSPSVTTRAIARYGTPMGTEPGASFNTTVTIQGIAHPSEFTCNLTYAGTVNRQ
jgi:hypothetical protein